jgi:hypothetical protein
MPTALIFTTDGKILFVRLRDLEDFKRHLGGSVAILWSQRDDLSAYVNDNGMTENLPKNPFYDQLTRNSR